MKAVQGGLDERSEGGDNEEEEVLYPWVPDQATVTNGVREPLASPVSRSYRAVTAALSRPVSWLQPCPRSVSGPLIPHYT